MTVWSERYTALLASTALTSLFLSQFLALPALAQNLPTGASVAAGSVSIAQSSATQLTVTQSSQSAIVNYQSFSVGQGSNVTFAQPNASSAILNRVSGNTPSSIAGSITANGQVYLVNPNGIAITPSGTVNVGGGFVASSLGISNADFMSGKRSFSGNGASADVSNAGSITVGRGGYAALIGGTVSNSGSITVPLGKVGLGSGERATLDFSGDGFLQVAAPTMSGCKRALVHNSGRITADGGQVILSAATAREAARNAINISGTIQARSIGGRSGSITIGGGDGGRVKITGRLIASSRVGHGGTVVVTGRDIALKGARIDASGQTGGGAITIGGGRQGSGPLQRAERVTVDPATTIKADAKQSGNGGNVTVWSDELTRFAGTISAKGGAQSGDGGEAEVSGKAKLDYTGRTILTAANGSFGTLLLDPYNITISNGADSNQSSFAATGNDSVINTTTLQDALATANVTVTTGAVGSAGGQAGNITVASPFGWSSNSRLTLTAANAIAINAPITISGGGKLSLNTATTLIGVTQEPLLSFGPGGNVTFASNAAQGSQSLKINGSIDYTLIRTMSDLPGLNGSATLWALATDLDASGQTYTNSVGGNFLGTLTGLGHSITNLTINAPGVLNVGLFASNSTTVRDLNIVGGSITGASNVGALAGTNSGNIIQVSSSAAVFGDTYVGGLVGQTGGGTITRSTASGAITATNGVVGGLIGQVNSGTVSLSSATGPVTSSGNYVGGLIGNNSGGSVTQTMASGLVSGNTYVGGLTGANMGAISQSLALGAVTGAINVGGLAGWSISGVVTQSYWNTQTSGRSNGVGSGSNSGVTGLTTRQLQGFDALPAGGALTDSGKLGTAFGGGANGLYPYLVNFYTKGVQAISGIAYKDGGATLAASGAGGAVTVSLDAGGTLLGRTTTGTDGVYYIAVPAGTIANGVSFITSVPTNGSLSKAAATLAASTYTNAAPVQSGINLYGGTLTASTNAASLSGAPSLAAMKQATNGIASATTATLISGLTGRGLVSTASSFTLDTTVDPTVTTVVKTNTGAPITVSAAQTLNAGGSLSLLSGGALRINANITANGVVPVTLAYDSSDVTNFGFGPSNSLTFSGAGGALNINGQGYTLLTAMSDLPGLNNQTGLYALANDLTAGTYNAAVISSFSGTLEGLGHTISNLTIASSGNAAVGLIGQLNSGTVRDLGLINASISGTVSGSGNSVSVGGLLGANVSGNVIQSSVTGSVSGSGDNAIVGGLVGTSSGRIVRSYASASVTGSGGGSGSTLSVGGLLGRNSGGSVLQSYATGSVTGSGSLSVTLGGLVGTNGSGSGTSTITQSYATGSVDGNATFIGGLVGLNSGGSGTTIITQSYATGSVGGSGSFAGGLVGLNTNSGGIATVTQSFWDTQTSGKSASSGGTGLTTGQLQGLDPLFSGSITDSNNLGSAFAGGANGLYPYLASFFPDGVQAISGVAYKDAGVTLAASSAAGMVPVTVTSGTTVLGTATTGANGYYYVFGRAGTIAAGQAFVAYTSANGNTGTKNAARLATSTYASNTPLQTGVNIWGSTQLLAAITNATTLSASGYDPTVSRPVPTGASMPAFLNGAIPTLAATDTSGFTIDTAVNTGAAFGVQTTSAGAKLTVAQPITVASGGALGLFSGGALRINANVTANGSVPVTLAYDPSDSSNFGFGSGNSLTFTGAGGSLAINGQAYTLLTSMSDLPGLDNLSALNAYALANDLTAPAQAYTGAVIGTFRGTLTGLGHTISNLIITGSTDRAGLIGTLSSGATVRDIGLVGGSVSGGFYVGGLVGWNSGTVTQSRSGVAVNGRSAGGLVGYNDSGTITQSMASGSVSGLFRIGGLLGELNGGLVAESAASGSVSGGSTVGGLVGVIGSGGRITQSAASGAVSGTDYVGGLVGGNYGGGTVSQSLATGSVAISNSGNGPAGGLIGENAGTVTQSYWDTQTSGQSVGMGRNVSSTSSVTGLTTRQLQGLDALPGGGAITDSNKLGTSFAGGVNGLYPYLVNFYPNGVQAITGTAYKDAGVTLAASGAGGAVTVSLDAGGTLLGRATTGANGVYYFALPAGTIANGTSFITSVPTTGTVSTAAATLAASTYTNVAPVQSGVHLYGGAFTAPTTAATLSAAPSLATMKQSATGVASAGTATLIAGLTGRGLLTSAASFTLDTAVDPAVTTVVKTGANVPLTVSAAQTLNAGGSLGLLSGGALRINANITANNASSVGLGFDTSDVTNFSFARGSSMNFAGAGGALAINGQGYTLIRSMADLDGIDGTAAVAGGTITNQTASGGTSGRYALANDLTALGQAYTRALISIFSGTLEGLGHAITNLTIDAPGTTNVGLIDSNVGTVRDLNLVGGSILGGIYTGSLVGLNSGTVVQVSSSAAVSGTTFVGGLIGFMTGGLVAQSAASGAVTGTNQVGGLIGYVAGGTVTQSSASGAVSGASTIGGLIGSFNNGSMTQSMATGSVTGGTVVGGLIGMNNNGSVSQNMATGAVSGAQAGGLIGANFGTVTQNYWDTETSGQALGVDVGSTTGITGLTTRQLQGLDALPGGGAITDSNKLGSNFAGGANGLYPYLKSFYPNGVQAITGFAQTNAGAALSAAQVALYSNGAMLGGAISSGANGYVYQIVPTGTLAAGSVKIGATLTPAGGNAVTGALYTDGASLSGNVMALGTIKAGLNAQTTAQLTSSGLRSDLGTTFSSAKLAALDTALATTPLAITATGTGFTVDQALTTGGDLSITTTAANASLTLAHAITSGTGTLSLRSMNGGVTQSSGSVITAARLTLLADTGIDLGGANRITTMASAINGSSGSIRINNASALSIGDAGFGIINNGGAVSISVASGNLTLTPNSSIQATGEIKLSTTGAFINNAGSTAVASSQNRWLVYSATSAGNSFGNLDSGNTAVWNTAPGAAVTQTGNRYIFAERPTLTVTTTDIAKTYGDNATSLVANAYTITGIRTGVTGAYRGDTLASVLSGTPVVTSTGSGVGAGVNGSPYAITADVFALTSPANYAIGAANAGRLSVNARPIIVTADAQSRIYGDANPVLTYTIGGRGLVNNDLLNGALATTATSTSNVGNYAITQGTLASSNYALTYTGATLSVAARPITVIADAKSRLFGEANPALTYTIGGRGLVNGDLLSGALATTAGPTSTAGLYPITQGSLAATTNYALAYTGADLSVTALPIVASTPVIDPSLLATNVASGSFGPIALPTNASRVFAPIQNVNLNGPSAFFITPQFEQSVVCYGGGSGLAQSCVSAN
jgi:filamentous hemagglutinin family protein